MAEAKKTVAGTKASGKAPRDEATRQINAELRKINERITELRDMIKSGQEERKTLKSRKNELKQTKQSST